MGELASGNVAIKWKSSARMMERKERYNNKKQNNNNNYELRTTTKRGRAKFKSVLFIVINWRRN